MDKRTKTFIEKATTKHGDKYNYSKVDYKTAKTKVKIFCIKHQEYFYQAPTNHLSGSGCPKCGMERSNKAKEDDQKSFLKKLYKKFPNIDKKFDFSKFTYKKSDVKAKVICRKHKEVFEIAPSNLLGGKGCPKCGMDKFTNSRRITQKQFEERVIKAQENPLDLSRANYVNSTTKVEVGCKTHGFYRTLPANLWKGHGCPKCGREKTINGRKYTFEKIVELALKAHDSLYAYPPNQKIKDCRDKMQIRCKKHGLFSQIIYQHLQGKGCPICSCNVSKKEKQVRDFLSKHVDLEYNNKKVIKPLELDIHIPNKKIAIEYNGLYYHSDKFLPNNYHRDKTNSCLDKDIKLIHIFSDEWNYKRSIVKSRLLDIIGKTPNKIYGRKTEVREVPTKEAMKFLDENHLQGRVGGKIKLGLYYKEELVSLMTFGSYRRSLGRKSKENCYEMLRFCNKKNHSVVGGASKLFKYFLENYNPKEVLSYADRRWSTGEMYYKLGFDMIGETKPNYFYTKGNKRENRFKYRKSEIIKTEEDKQKTEKEIMSERGYFRVYDSGCLKFLYTCAKV